MKLYPAIEIRGAASLDLELDGLGVTAVEERDDSLRVFFTHQHERDAALAHLRALPQVRAEPIEVSDEDWAERSQAALEPITVGGWTISPPWAVTPELTAATGTHLVIIQPSMGFGTGHHASTRLCLTLLQEVSVAEANVLDVGTGSGVLAIVAAKLGAASVTAIDLDPDALTSARDNLGRNGVPQVAVHEMDLAGAADSLGPRFDVLLANLTGGLLCREAGRFAQLGRERARLIASGFQPDEDAAVTAALEAAGWTRQRRIEESGWIGARFVKR